MKIQDKNSKIIPFKLNKPQQKLYDALGEQNRQGKPMRAIVLKARQMGFSTLTEAMIFKRTATNFNVKSGIIAHEASATNNLFNMSKRYYDNLDDSMKPSVLRSNAKEIIFNNEAHTGLNSSIKCMTAGNGNVGRSDTFMNVHMSEYAFWGDNKADIFLAIMQSVPRSQNTLVIVESTANGYDDFKQLWDDAVAGRNDFVPVFCAWWELEEYRSNYDGFELTDEEKKLKELYNLDNEQLAWRRWCIQNNCRGDVNSFKQEYPSSPDEAFLSTGGCVFDKEKVISRIEEIKDKEPLKIGSFFYDYDGLSISNIRWIDDKNGIIKIYKDVEPSHYYVLGGDTAGDGSDNFIGEVLDNISGEQVAELSHKTDEDLYARQMYCLGKYYNTALIGVEVNYSTYPQKELERLEYPLFYQRRQEDTISGRYIQKLGFNTNSVTRPVILAALVELIRDNTELFNSVEFLRECLSFIKNAKGRPEAEIGQHDDRVMAMAIAHHIREQQIMKIATEKTKQELREDYLEQLEEDKIQEFINFGGDF